MTGTAKAAFGRLSFPCPHRHRRCVFRAATRRTHPVVAIQAAEPPERTVRRTAARSARALRLLVMKA
jgi:hypothetical protein